MSGQIFYQKRKITLLVSGAVRRREKRLVVDLE